MMPVEDVSCGPCGWCRTTHPVDAPHVTDPHTPTEEETTVTATPDTSTGYHESVDHLRRDLMRAYEQYTKAVQEHRPPQALAETTPVQATAYMSSLAAQGYSYTLAAVLGYAARKFGPEVARALACVADEVMENGDDRDINGDVLPV